MRPKRKWWTPARLKLYGEEMIDSGLIEFLKTKTPTEDLKTALRVIEEFKQCEYIEEWLQPFEKWTRLEQLQDYLRLLTGVGSEIVSDEWAKEYLKKHRRGR